MNFQFAGGVWPVMLTPFTKDREIDFKTLKQLVEWYIERGSSGLFAVCQSSEMFYLSFEERARMTREIKKCAGGRIPIITSGHISYSIAEQIRELNEMADAGADAVILLSNRLAAKDESDSKLLENLKTIMEELPKDVPLGFYECPYPYKRILSKEVIEFCVNSERFCFLKDTSCDMKNIREKLSIMKGSRMKLYNANTATLLQSMREGAAGYSGVMANFHPELYVWLTKNWKNEPEKAELLQGILTMSSFIELKNYPLSAKYYMRQTGLSIQANTRKNNEDILTDTEISEILQLKKLSEEMMNLLVK